MRRSNGTGATSEEKTPVKVRPLTVLQSFPQPRPTTNPYVAQLAASLPPDVRVLTFTWREALVGRWDVFHVHWPEILVRGRGGLNTTLRQLATLALLLRIKITGRALVRTMHNLGPHERPGRSSALLLSLVDRWTTVAIDLTTATAGHLGRPSTVVPHGHYRRWFATAERPATVPGRLLFFGLVRPYKQVPELVAAFRQTEDPSLTLHVAGACIDAHLADRVTRSAAGDPRVSLVLEHLDDVWLAREIGESELVVLPYAEMINSGAALLALSLDRPVLVPSTEVNAQLSSEVGRGWVRLLPGPVSAEALGSALEACRADPPLAQPDLDAREWDVVGTAHANVYRQAAMAPRWFRRLPWMRRG